MAVHFLTSIPKALLGKFNARIAQDEAKGKITTWEISDDGRYYTHKAAEWHAKASFKPVIGIDRLTFNIIKPKDQNVSSLAYAYYHGHWTETFLNHFDKDFSGAVSTALAVTGDHCSS